MKSTKRVAVGIGVATIMGTIAATLPSAPAQAAISGIVTNCPRGAACLYKYDKDDRLIEVARWWNGVYNLDGIWGEHYLVNNQTDNWVIQLCDGYDGTKCHSTLWRTSVWEDMSPINSVYLRYYTGYSGTPSFR